MVAQDCGNGKCPDVGSPDPRGYHDAASNKETLCRSVDDAEIERVGVIGLPCGKEHGKTGAQGSKDTHVRRAQAHGCCFE